MYDRRRFVENAERLIGALDRAGLRHRVRFALKANPDPAILAALRGLVGIDACSPGEVLRALECGWTAGEISYTGTNVSERDLDVVLAQPLHAARRGERDRRRVGVRVAERPGHPDLAASGSAPAGARRVSPGPMPTSTAVPGRPQRADARRAARPDGPSTRSARRPSTGSSRPEPGSAWRRSARASASRCSLTSETSTSVAPNARATCIDQQPDRPGAGDQHAVAGAHARLAARPDRRPTAAPSARRPRRTARRAARTRSPRGSAT